MGLPWRAISFVSLGFAYLITSKKSVLGILANFTAAWAAQFFGWAVYRVILYPKFFSPFIGLPEPPGNSFYNGQWRRIAAEPSGSPMMEWINTIPNDGLIRFLSMFNAERIIPVSAKALAEVLVTKNYDFLKPTEFRTGFGRILGMGLLFAEGDEHKAQRRSLLPAFAFRHVKDLVPTFWDKSREGVLAMSEYILREAAKAAPAPNDEKPANHDTVVMEVGNWASRITLDIIGVAGLGRDFGAIKDPSNELNQTYQNLFKPNKQARVLGMLSLVLGQWFVNLLPVKRNKTIHHSADIIRGVCRELVVEKKRMMADKKAPDVDILSVALESGSFTDDALVDHLMTFLAAGHETTASAMTWAVYMLCLHQDVQEKLREEVRSKLPSLDDGSAAVSALDIDHMPYLNAFISEVLRYWAPAPLTFRVAGVDTTILDQPVPKGTRVMIAPWAVNKSREMWGEDAEKFNPDRWLPRFEGDKGAAGGHATSNYAFLTFLHGPRSCIGQAFARAEFACLVAAWVGRCKFEINDPRELDERNIEIKGGITARPAKGMWVKATVLDGW